MKYIKRSYNYRAEVYTKKQLIQSVSDSDFEYVYVPVNLFSSVDINEKEKIIINPPVFLGGNENDLLNKLKAFKKKGYNSALAHTLGHLELISAAGLIPRGGFRLNVTNSKALKVYESLGLYDCILSFELKIKQAELIAKEAGIPTGIIAYGNLPFILTRRCPVSDGKTCGGNNDCNKIMTDRFGNKLDFICGNTVEILNPDKLCLSDKQNDLMEFDFLTFRFTDETDINKIKSLYEKGVRPEGKFTRGLYYKGVK